ncbi:MAG: hypothetical protein LUD47_03130 [Clostridia bacterium]|nr:hypothetical protein [Clostridia bacterium]
MPKKEDKTIEEEKISFSNVAHKFNEATGDERGQIEEYTQYVKNMEEAIDVLDGYDDFSSLNIAASAYEYREGETYGYGIKRMGMHGRGRDSDVILKHQKNAAQMFLENLRGFGLLADVVGSGKTFEAGVVLSELTYRGKVGTLLIVAISEVLSSWEDVICTRFGLGDALVVIKEEKDRFSVKKDGVTEDLGKAFKWSDYIECNGKRPVRPVLVDLEVFKYLSKDRSFSSGCIFDMIIVDEAHELCNENNIAAMGLLSDMIAKKKADGSGQECYCLLLSATPHNGNLKGMFPLWYFICRRGGDPGQFFNGSSEEHSAEYNEEFKHYNKDICFGADNISDFVRGKKIYDFQKLGNNADAGMRLHLRHYLEKQGKNIEKDFDAANVWTKERVIDDFLGVSDLPNSGLPTEVVEKKKAYRAREEGQIASAYKNLLSLIMIRQDRNTVMNVSMRRKKVVNLFFCPVRDGSFGGGVVDGVQIDGGIRLDYGKVFSSFPEVYYPDVLKGDVRGGIFDDTSSPQARYAEVVGALLKRLDDEKYRVRGVRGFKGGYLDYYTTMMSNFDDNDADSRSYRAAVTADDGQYNLFMPYTYRAPSDAFDNKFDYFLRILRKHRDDKVIVFFDYDRASNNAVTHVDGTRDASLYDKFDKLLRSKVKTRRIISIESAGADTEEKIAEFNDEANAACVLVVKGGFTHGANLQQASVIVNFQVSCDPVDMEQKIGRIFRLGQTRDVTVYSMADVNELEGYALAYFTGIGLFAVDNGDASILSGCNDSEMVTVRCSECGRVAIMTKTEYDTYRASLNLGEEKKPVYLTRINKSAGKMYTSSMTGGGLLSEEEKEIPYDEKYTKREGMHIMCQSGSHASGDIVMMSPINNGEFVCSSDKTHKFMRGKGEGDAGYKCMDPSGQLMCSTGEKGSRAYFCNKLCAISRCGAHRREFPGCAARKAFEVGEPFSACIDKCLDGGDGGRCKYYDKCKRGINSHRCMPESSYQDMERSIYECIDCIEYNKDLKYSFNCSPKPHVLSFNEDWSGADCPICRAQGSRNPGQLQKVPMRTFSEHIGYLWDIDREGSTYFCGILISEAKKVGEIEKILQESGKGE